jgi:hypothetical protein
MLRFHNTVGVIFGAESEVIQASLPVASSRHPCLLLTRAGWEACTTGQAGSLNYVVRVPTTSEKRCSFPDIYQQRH